MPFDLAFQPQGVRKWLKLSVGIREQSKKS
jgi:hypothetical protein